jgi:hypothetical protein
MENIGSALPLARAELTVLAALPIVRAVHCMERCRGDGYGLAIEGTVARDRHDRDGM